jgi:hypothetical protein
VKRKIVSLEVRTVKCLLADESLVEGKLFQPEPLSEAETCVKRKIVSVEVRTVKYLLTGESLVDGNLWKPEPL